MGPGPTDLPARRADQTALALLLRYPPVECQSTVFSSPASWQLVRGRAALGSLLSSLGSGEDRLTGWHMLDPTSTRHYESAAAKRIDSPFPASVGFYLCCNAFDFKRWYSKPEKDTFASEAKMARDLFSHKTSNRKNREVTSIAWFLCYSI
ncbi:hypothetical protein ROHU_015508 [Labeo rohita]|uniref:Uncharacterized protein n=1 Tax=Labeo rohita TaxID=84645 RepID=A0A498NNU7_LABRO|nr:hypothetical protein ROHU_015508 [Labeo rohita]